MACHLGWLFIIFELQYYNCSFVVLQYYFLNYKYFLEGCIRSALHFHSKAANCICFLKVMINNDSVGVENGVPGIFTFAFGRFTATVSTLSEITADHACREMLEKQ